MRNKLLFFTILLSILVFNVNPVLAQTATLTATPLPTFGPTCVATVGPGTPTPLITFGPTCAVTVAPTATKTPTATPKPTNTPIPTPTPAQLVPGNLGITITLLGIAAFSVLMGITTLLSTKKYS